VDKQLGLHPEQNRGGRAYVQPFDYGVYDLRFVMDIKIQRERPGLGGRLFSLVGIVGLMATIIAGATVWLLLTDPVTVAESMDSGEVTPLVQSLAGSIYDALVRLMRML
jgi:hypothetical protein